MRVRLTDTKADWHHVQKQRVVPGLAAGAQIIARLEHQLIAACHKLTLRQDRAVCAPVVIGGHFDQFLARISVQPVEGDLQPLGRAAFCRVQNMGGQIAGHAGASFLITLTAFVLPQLCSHLQMRRARQCIREILKERAGFLGY